MMLNPKNKIIDVLIKAHLDQLSEEESEVNPPFPSFNGGSDDSVSFGLYQEWLKTPADTSIPNAEGLFNSVASRLKISTSKRNRDKFIFSDILTSGTAIIKRGVYNLLTFITLVIGGSEALANSMLPNLKEGVFLINSGKHEISGKKIHAFFALRTLDIKSIPINEYIEEMLKSQNPKKPNAYVTKKMIEIETNGFENRKWNHYLQKTTR